MVFRDIARRSAINRLKKLEELEAKAKEHSRNLIAEEIVETFISGYFPVDNDMDGELLANLILKNRLFPAKWTTDIISEELDVMAKRFIRALMVAAPI